MIAQAASAVLLVAGCAFFAAGTIGLLRFPSLHTRLHALTKADNLGLGLIMAGLIIQSGSAAVAAKLVAIWALALLASATSGHLLARGAEPDDPAAGSP